VRDEPQPVRRAVARDLLDRLAARLGATARSSSVIALAIHVTSWCGDEAAQRGDEPAAAAPRDTRCRPRRA
jgi:hypothetical protein